MVKSSFKILLFQEGAEYFKQGIFTAKELATLEKQSRFSINLFDAGLKYGKVGWKCSYCAGL